MNVNHLQETGAAWAAVATQAAPPGNRAPAAPSPGRSVNAEPPPETVKAAVTEANRHLAASGQKLEMSWDTDTRRVLVKLVDAESKEVIRQIPTEEAVALAKRLASLGERFTAEA